MCKIDKTKMIIISSVKYEKNEIEIKMGDNSKLNT